MVFPRFGAVIFVHGCFWHFHGCYRSTIPKSRHEFWKSKFRDNQERDERNISLLQKCGWRVMTVWECALVGKEAMLLDDLVEHVYYWLAGKKGQMEIPVGPEKATFSNQIAEDG